MQIEKIQSTKDLALNLKENPVLRYCCGFNVFGNVPSESTFSRFLDKLTDTQELEQLFYDLVIKAKELNIVDGEHVSIDSTRLDSYEAAKPKKSIVDDGTTALPLIKQFFGHYNNIFRPTYYAMDSGYDLDYVYKDIINRYNGIPIIAYNPKCRFKSTFNKIQQIYKPHNIPYQAFVIYR